MSAGKFPRAYTLGPRTVGWLESEIDQWIDQQIATTRHSRGEGMI
jgi:prophage regulatory protein